MRVHDHVHSMSLSSHFAFAVSKSSYRLSFFLVVPNALKNFFWTLIRLPFVNFKIKTNHTQRIWYKIAMPVCDCIAETVFNVHCTIHLFLIGPRFFYVYFIFVSSFRWFYIYYFYLIVIATIASSFFPLKFIYVDVWCAVNVLALDLLCRARHKQNDL